MNISEDVVVSVIYLKILNNYDLDFTRQIFCNLQDKLRK
jgi:hypothetical protein